MRITIVNVELMVYDIVVKLGVNSPQTLDKGPGPPFTFKPSDSDTDYFSVPGHRQTGIQGRLEVSNALNRGRRRQVSAHCELTCAETWTVEGGTLDDWTAAGDGFQIVHASGADRAAPTGRTSACVRAQTGTLSFRSRSTHPYASFPFFA